MISAIIGPLLGIDLSAGAVGGALGLSGTLATAVGGGLEGAATGALTGGALGAATGGKNIGTDILGGALTGGIAAEAAPLASVLGVTSSTGVDAIGAGLGALGGIAGSAVEGGNLGTGALTGGALGLASTALGGGAGNAGSPAAPAGASAATTSAPASVGGTPVDLTAANTGILNNIGNDVSQAGNWIANQVGLGSGSTPAAGTGTGTVASAANLPSTDALLAATSSSPATTIGGGGAMPSITNLPSTENLLGIGTGGASSPQAITSSLFNSTAAPSISEVPTGMSGPATISGGTGSSTGTGIVSQLENAFQKNPLGVLAGGGGLLYSLISGSQLQGNINQLQGQASALSSQAGQLESYLQSGTLPAGLQTQVNQATQSAKAQVRSYYAGLGLSGSSMEQQALQQVDQNAITSTAQIGEQLLQTGINESSLSGELLEGVIGANQKQAQSTGTAIASLAAALSGRSGITLNLTGQTGLAAAA